MVDGKMAKETDVIFFFLQVAYYSTGGTTAQASLHGFVPTYLG
jgi:hypothetical protein